MKGILAIALALGMAVQTGHAVNLRYDAIGVKLVEASLEEAVFETDSDDAKRWEVEIRDQMHYLISQLRFINSTPGLWHSLNLRVKKVSKGTYGKTRVVYGATFVASWPRANYAKNTITAVFPVRGDAEGMDAFEGKYLAACGGHGPMWYYLAPNSPNCPLGRPELPEDAQRVTITVKDSPLNTSGKSPEYGKIWEDGQLVITHVMGNTISLEERMLHVNFKQQFPGATTRVVTRSFFHETQVSEQMTAAGKIVLRTMRLKTGNVQEATPEFIEEFQGYLQDTDVISYNGHAGLGKNIRAFSKMVKLTPGRYYLMWINACVPFAYFDDTLFAASKAANPDVPWSKHLDILIATGVGYFAETSDIRELMTGLVKKATFRQLMPRFENFSPMVLGEEDNNWPKPF